MQLVQGIYHLPHMMNRSVVTVGNFDGVHEGHRALIRRLVEKARSLQASSVVFTFQPHPVQVLYPDRALAKLFPFRDQQDELGKFGVDYLIVEPFSREFSQLDPETFLTDYILRPLSPVHLIVGYDFTFGANRKGTIEFLQATCEKLGVSVEILSPVRIGDAVVSSTRIRQALAEGNVSLAKRLLGRPFYVNGVVEKGAGRGHTIGVPTANLHLDAETVPARGVYACYAGFQGQKYKAVANLGYNPTFVETSEAPHLEVHLLDFSADLYGEHLRVEFVERLREEKKFASVEALIAQIRTDIDRSRRLLE